MNKTEEMVEEIVGSLLGHVAMEGVTRYVVEYVNEKYGTTFEDTTDLVEFAQKHDAEITECENCGWYVDYVDDVDGIGACTDCYEELTYEDED
jgi:hypothetical protein